jgi:hypothetical protein
MAGSMILVDLDFDRVELLLKTLVKTLDKQIGQGPASVALIDYMAGETLEFLWENTHQFAPLLYMSYKLQGDTAPVRGFFDPQGLVREIVVDPTVTAAVGEPPVEYAPIEFSRGGGHDTFALASLHFESWFDGGMKKFESELGKSLGF